MYKIGDYIVKAMSGVCKIEGISHLDMLGADKNKMYYLLVPVEDNKGKIYAPTEMINTNTRRVMSEGEAWELIENFPKVEEAWIDNEKIRQGKYKEAVNNCDPEALVRIIKMIYERKRQRMAEGKKNTAVDERYYKMAENYLYSELGFVLHKNREEVYGLIVESIGNE